MQLASVLAQPAAQPTSTSPSLPILTTLSGERLPASATAATPPPVAAEQSQPSLGQKLLGGVAEQQNKYLANQQMLAVISAGLGARFSAIASGVWATLRGPKEQAVEPEAAPTEAAPTSVG